jgi:hypothetical protein
MFEAENAVDRNPQHQIYLGDNKFVEKPIKPFAR